MLFLLLVLFPPREPTRLEFGEGERDKSLSLSLFSKPRFFLFSISRLFKSLLSTESIEPSIYMFER